MIIFSIDTLSFSNTELKVNDGNFSITREVNTQPQEEYSIGQNKNFFPLNIRSKRSTYKYDITLLLTKDKFLELENLKNYQLDNKIRNFKVGSDWQNAFFTFDSPFTYGTSYVIVRELNLKNSLLDSMGNIIYECELKLEEVVQ